MAALGLVGQLVSAGGAIIGGIRASRAAKAQAQVESAAQLQAASAARANAVMSRRDAEQTKIIAGRAALSSQETAMQQDFDAARQIGDAVVAAGLTGGRTGDAVISSLRMLAQQDRRNLRERGDMETAQVLREVDRLRSEESDLLAEGEARERNAAFVERAGRRNARSALIGGVLGATGSLISIGDNDLVRNWWARRGTTRVVRPMPNPRR